MFDLINYIAMVAQNFDSDAYRNAAGFSDLSMAAFITALSFSTLFLIGAISVLIGGMSAIMAGAKIRTVIGIIVVTFILLALFTTIFSLY